MLVCIKRLPTLCLDQVLRSQSLDNLQVLQKLLHAQARLRRAGSRHVQVMDVEWALPVHEERGNPVEDDLLSLFVYSARLSRVSQFV